MCKPCYIQTIKITNYKSDYETYFWPYATSDINWPSKLTTQCVGNVKLKSYTIAQDERIKYLRNGYWKIKLENRRKGKERKPH